MQSCVCTGCGCLCDDIGVEVEGGVLSRIENACAKGVAYLRSAGDPARRPRSLVAGREVSLDQAIEEAADLLSGAENCLVFGLDSSTIEAQQAGVELARVLGAVIDDGSFFAFGDLMERITNGEVPTCSLGDIKDNADLLVYWGSDPPHTHPRHLSMFTYLTYSDFDPIGWLPKGVKLTCVDVRDSEFMSVCRPAFKIEPGGDREFIRAVMDAADTHPEAAAFAKLVGAAQFCVVFCGQGLTYSLGGDFGIFCEMVNGLAQSRRMAVIPMVAEANMRGFAATLREATGRVNQVSFSGGVLHGQRLSFLEQVRNHNADCLLVVGADPFATLPQGVMAELVDADIVCLSSFVTATTAAADVVIPVAVPGVEYGGKMLRMDGDEVSTAGVIEASYPHDADVLRRLLESAL